MNDRPSLTFARRKCPRCARVTRQEISCRIAGNRARFFGWWCLCCKSWTPSRRGGVWIPKHILLAHKVDLSLAPIVEWFGGPRCARCGARGAEQHHWAPRAIFHRESETWPTDYLCKPCHHEWHRRVTPQFVTAEFSRKTRGR